MILFTIIVIVPLTFVRLEIISGLSPFLGALDMIACDDTDLFGGRISTVAAVEFCCQVETSGEGLHQPPVTAVHNLLHAGDVADPRALVILTYDAMWHSTSLSVPHKMIVNFLESLAAGDNRISLRQALEMASLKFGYFGEWKWPASSASEMSAKNGPLQHANADPGSSWSPGALPVGDGRDRFADFQGHTDSPLAD